MPVSIATSDLARFLCNVNELAPPRLSSLDQKQATKSSTPHDQDLRVVYVKDLHSEAILTVFNGVKTFLGIGSALPPQAVKKIRSEASRIAKKKAKKKPGSGVSGNIWLRLDNTWRPFHVRFDTTCLTDTDLLIASVDEVRDYNLRIADIGGRGYVIIPVQSKVENGQYVAQHTRELQSQAKLGSETKHPIAYPHENVVVHVAQLRTEALLRQEAPKKGGIIYDKGRLTTIAEASNVSGIKLGTIYNYLSDGKLTVRGRIFSSVPGGGRVIIDLDELDSVLSSRKPGGRPRIIHEHLTGKRPRGRPRKTPRAEEVEPKLITLKEAVKTHDIGYETLRSWYRSGHLPERGREVFGTHGGGKILVAEEGVIHLKSQPPRRGKPPIDPT